MKKILTSLLVIGIVGVGAFGASRAFFSDTETSTGNMFTAGSIDLKVGSTIGNTVLAMDDLNGQALFNFNDVKPGDRYEGSFQMSVTSNNAYACLMSETTSTQENTHLEAEIESGDTTTGLNGGELQDYLQFAFFADRNNNGLFDTGDSTLNYNQFPGGDSNGYTLAELDEAGWQPLAQAGDKNATLLVENSLTSGGTYSLGFIACFGNITSTGECVGVNDPNENQAQTDQVIGKLIFYSIQTRNNAAFRCSDLNEEELNETLTYDVDGTVPAKVTVEDLGDSITWTIDIDETSADDDNGHYAYGLVISTDGTAPTYQIHNNDGTDSSFAWGEHLYSAYSSGWHTSNTNTKVTDLSWVNATGNRDIATNPNGIFTITINKSDLTSTFYWGVALMADTSDTQYPPASQWSKWGASSAGMEQYDL